jgi:hypothetical protein
MLLVRPLEKLFVKTARYCLESSLWIDQGVGTTLLAPPGVPGSAQSIRSVDSVLSLVVATSV